MSFGIPQWSTDCHASFQNVSQSDMTVWLVLLKWKPAISAAATLVWWFRLLLLCDLCFTLFPSLAPNQDWVALVHSGPTYVSYHFHTAAYYSLISFIIPRLHKAKKWSLDLSFALGEVFSCQNAAIWHLLCLVAIHNRGHILESRGFFFSGFIINKPTWFSLIIVTKAVQKKYAQPHCTSHWITVLATQNWPQPHFFRQIRA